jgi:hypothetical protein
MVALDTEAWTARRHRAGMRIGQRYLMARGGEHLRLKCMDALLIPPMPRHRFIGSKLAGLCAGRQRLFTMLERNFEGPRAIIFRCLFTVGIPASTDKNSHRHG